MMTEKAYLTTSFEKPCPEFVNGELEERGLPTFEHGNWILAIAMYFRQHAEEWSIRVSPELHTWTKEDHWRIPDVAVFERDQPVEARLTKPPVAVFEVKSPNQTKASHYEKFVEYAAMGIPHIWFVDPEDGVLMRWKDGYLQPLPIFNYQDGRILFNVDEIKTLLD